MLNCTKLRAADKLHRAFRLGLALPATFDVTSAESSTLSRWDSVAHLQLVVAIEDSFDIRLDPADVVSLKSYSSAIQTLQRHGVWGNE